MTLRYIFHSGFVLETKRCILVFDYWMDPAGVMRVYMNTCKHVYVFSSHFHKDHFTKEIFKWKHHIPNTTYILSKDILKHRRAQREDADVWMAKGAVWEDENLKVTATGRKRTEQREQKPSWLGLCRVASDEGEANDSGVSWIVETEGKTIFHAGDLCNWYARFLDDNTPEGEVFREEFGQYINPVAEEKQFLGELKDIRKKCYFCFSRYAL